MKTVKVNIPKYPYEILIGKGILEQLVIYLKKFDQIQSVSIVSDDTVSKHHLAKLLQVLEESGLIINTLIIKTGEKSKSWNNLKRVTEWLIEKRVERRDFVIGMGGGVIGDLVGFAASIVRRGIKVIHVPTSLLAQVDSAIGGKTSINSNQGKNLIGTFYQPSLVLSDVTMLRTLKGRDFRSGYGEVIKYSLIKDCLFFNWLEKQDIATLQASDTELIHMVERSSKIKAGIIEKDEKEQGIRALLNFGHTFGHALEAATGYSNRLLHGEGVILGSCLALNLSKDLNLIDEEEINRIKRYLISNGFKTKIDQIPGEGLSLETLLNLMYQDKKVTSNQLNFVLLKKIGEGILVNNVDPENVKNVLLESMN